MRIVREISDKDFMLPDKMSSAEPQSTIKIFLLNETGNVAVIFLPATALYTFPTGTFLDHETFETSVSRIIGIKTGYTCKIIARLGTIYENSAELNYARYTSLVVTKVVKQPAKDMLESIESKLQWYTIDGAYSVVKGLSARKTLAERYAKQRDMLAIDVLVKYINTHHDVFRNEFG